ncbi:ATP-binding cassette domain-containing protein [Paenibacillus sp. YYML68]|uniref:ABC transporter ATP-binding protein n=1 Tax=Paenibacillus sp. YYML68 TaxID=2909250 RepID=UPI002491B1F9|nr:ATP-binding cassette domain-containing protein [Paenibacillus sp. YYML68]
MIEAKDLWKVYTYQEQRKGFWGSLNDLFSPIKKTKEAVRGINFNINQGEAVGYIGTNGSGKSTTIKLLTGILQPTSGAVLVNGINPKINRKENALQIGTVFGQRSQLLWDLAIHESFELFRFIYKIKHSKFKQNLNLMTELLRLDEFSSIPVRQLSLGQRMRAEIACAFLHDPTIVYLDEPTIGLDVVAKERIRSFLREIKTEKKTTIILTSHDMDDIEQVSDRMILIDHGQILYNGGTIKFIEHFGKERILTIHFENEITDISLKSGVLLSFNNKEARILFSKEDISATKLIESIISEYPVIDCSIEEPKIEHLVRNVYNANNQTKIEER